MLISSHSLSVKFGDQRVLDGIDVSIEAGEIVTIVGPNGSGKSTLLKSLIGAIHPYSGEIVRAPDLSIGYVPQRLFIDDTLPMTVARFLNLPNKRSQTVVKEALTNAGVGGFEKKQLKSLSGGQLQRVLLARVLLEKPNLLLLDEATQGLDRRGVSEFYRQVVAVRDALNCAVVMVSHDLHAVMRYSDRVICLNGSICCQGAPQTVLASHAYHALFGLDDDTCQHDLDSKAAWLEGVADVG